MKALNEYSISNSFVVKEIEIIFSFLPLFELSSTYINFKQDEENLEKNLSTKVNERFDMLKNNCEQNNNDFTIMANLQKEMRSTFPLLDSSYDEICNLILLRKKEQISRENVDVIISELTKSSNKNLCYLSDIIKNEPYWTNEQLTCIHDSHANFLKEEFFNIVHGLFPKKVFIMIYADNMNILNKKINDDSKIIDSLFDEFHDMAKQKMPKVKKFVKGMNTTIKEREYEREIKARIGIEGNLEDLIEQDF